MIDGLESRTALFDVEEMPGWLGQTPIAVIVPDIYDRTAGAREIGELQRRVAQYSSDVELFTPTNCGHFVQLERPDVVADAVCGVVRRALASRGMETELQDGRAP
jgi:pimeloyl-ACP methyl ester carboxylesterase